jgi:hypothetical protein
VKEKNFIMILFEKGLKYNQEEKVRPLSTSADEAYKRRNESY